MSAVRIAEISTLAQPVPPDGEGSIESLVASVVDGLARRGHEVTLFALPGSSSPGALRSPVPFSYKSGADVWDWSIYEAFQVREAFRAAADFDLIHCHSYHHGLLFCDFVSCPSLHSIHTEPGPDYRFLASRCRNGDLLFASRYQARDFPDDERVHIIPHGIDVDAFRAAEPRPAADYFAFLGRLMPDKGVLATIELARRADIPLKIAAPPNDYYREVVRPLVDGRNVEYVGELSGGAKSEFLANALALLYPVERGEPFGLVLVESMACGTPVLARGQGAVPEIVRHGETGWISDDFADLEEAVAAVARMDRATIRRTAVEEYSSATMVDRLERLMTRLVERGPAT